MISGHESEKLSLQEIEQFLLAATGVRFEASQRKEAYAWVERLLCQREYARQGRRARGLLRRYIEKMTGLSRLPVPSRLILGLEDSRVLRFHRLHPLSRLFRGFLVAFELNHPWLPARVRAVRGMGGCGLWCGINAARLTCVRKKLLKNYDMMIGRQAACPTTLPMR